MKNNLCALTSTLVRHPIHDVWLPETGKPVTMATKTSIIDYSDCF